MMLLAVLTCQSATETAQRHWPSWREHFENIVFVTPIDSKCWVPEGVQEWKAGRDYYLDRDRPDDNLPRRTIETLDKCLMTKHDYFVIAEYDCLFFSTPKPHGKFFGTMFNEFIHPPWGMNRNDAARFVRAGRALLQNNLISGGWPDRHMRALYDLVSPESIDVENYSKNTLDHPWMIEEARMAIERGAFSIHGVKTQDQFNALTS